MNKFASNMMYSKVMKITPEIASEMLANNSNRKLDQKYVKAFADMMKRGKFVLSPDGISFDTNGNLINGQHRLSGVVESGCSVDMFVTFGCNDSAIGVLDIGRRRTFANHVQMFCNDKKWITSTMTQSAVRSILSRRSQALKYSMSNSEFEELMLTNSDVIRVFYNAMGSASNLGMSSADYGALFEAMLVTQDVDALIAYRNAYTLGKIDTDTNYNYGVVFALKNRVSNTRTRHQRIDFPTLYNLVQSAFSSFISARKIEMVRSTKNDCYRIDVQKFVNGSYNNQFSAKASCDCNLE